VKSPADQIGVDPADTGKVKLIGLLGYFSAAVSGFGGEGCAKMKNAITINQVADWKFSFSFVPPHFYFGSGTFKARIRTSVNFARSRKKNVPPSVEYRFLSLPDIGIPSVRFILQIKYHRKD